MEVKKSPRHSKIAGDFFEHLIMYLLSKNGFECIHVDYIGIDVIAKNPHTKKVMGISVKGRTRTGEQTKDRVKISNGNFDKMKTACETFNCRPYLAIIVDAEKSITGVITSLDNIEKKYPPTKSNLNWNMNSIDTYRSDDNCKVFEFNEGIHKWW
jgi:Holliday junction resolvase